MDVISVRTPTCEVCGRAVAIMSDGKPRRTCSPECRREAQARHISAYRNRSGQTNCLDADGRLPTDPSPEHIAQCCDVFRSRHLAEMRAKG